MKQPFRIFVIKILTKIVKKFNHNIISFLQNDLILLFVNQITKFLLMEKNYSKKLNAIYNICETSQKVIECPLIAYKMLSILVPSFIGKYSFRGTIGSGAFSVVKLAFNNETSEFLACKIVPRSRICDGNLESRFESEIRINQQMHHPGIVQIVDLLRDNMNYYIFLELCPNGELFHYIVNKKSLDEKEAATFVSQILEAINYVHQQGVAHRDLKPENILLDSSWQIKISDFGLSKFVGNSGIVSTPCGSPCYISPECLTGKDYDGRASDNWSIGVIVFVMVTGQIPWTKRNHTQLFEQIKSGEYTIPSHLSDECRNFIRGLMEVDASKRTTISEALKHPWITKNADKNTKGKEDQNRLSMKIISLKTIDKFFENNSSTFIDVDSLNFSNNTLSADGDVLRREKTQSNMDFGTMIKAIEEPNTIFPNMMTKNRRYMMVRPILNNTKPSAYTPPPIIVKPNVLTNSSRKSSIHSQKMNDNVMKMRLPTSYLID
ncbi:CAMK family protein kinase [Tritrichomonas foetus]|uniref:CAMK family protein kinase n=1 Tax=Tritrichomonas foetus TaxID=1144522 RepID=A0A1J4KWA8_9EUKA|nr:CAMK family protein kinase [Tritrichomonas foetus]|eukprot:OHT14036.1 CAMK family protein kinase [Tritrichomonas foetus]